MKTQICKECGCIGKRSKALLNQLVSFDDFGNDAGKRGTTQSRQGKAKQVGCLKCPNCGHSWIPEKSDREKAIEWWMNIYTTIGRVNLQEKHLGTASLVRKITDEEIEQIWRKETQLNIPEIGTEEFNNMCQSFFSGKPKEEEKREQVDFEMLNNMTLNSDISALKLIYSKEELDNISLFFELLSKSSSFAHKAHKELNKLNQ